MELICRISRFQVVRIVKIRKVGFVGELMSGIHEKCRIGFAALVEVGAQSAGQRKTPDEHHGEQKRAREPQDSLFVPEKQRTAEVHTAAGGVAAPLRGRRSPRPQGQRDQQAEGEGRRSWGSWVEELARCNSVSIVCA
jgi:hypothetical protein